MAEIVKEETDIIKGETAVPDKAPKEKMDIPRLWWTTRPQQKPAETQFVTHYRLVGHPLTKDSKSKLGEYLMIVAKVADAMDYEADERLLRENLHRDPPLHIRRTLDQSYFLTLEDTGARDKDQVVYRETRQGKSHYARNTRVVMVDQLWLWILGGSEWSPFRPLILSLTENRCLSKIRSLPLSPEGGAGTSLTHLVSTRACANDWFTHQTVV
jgi:hypothetical protein